MDKSDIQDNVRVDARNSTIQQHLNGSQNDDEESKQKIENDKTGCFYIAQTKYFLS